MANIKNFGLVGVGSDLQFGKAGVRIINDTNTFKLRTANNGADVALTAAGITSSGNVTLTVGNIDLNAAGAKVTIGGTDIIQRAATGMPQLAGTAGVILPTGTTAQRGTASLGQVRVNSDVENAATVEFYDGDGWITLATGGSTGALQTEIDAIETSLGAGINVNGTFNANGFTDVAALADPTSFTDAINQIAAYASSKDTLAEIIAPGAAGNVIYSNGTDWVTGLPGATSGVQGYDAGLAALAAKTSTGIMVQTGADTYTSVSLVAPTEGLTISNADGTGGAPTFALANDLAALEGLTGTGFAVRTGTDTWAQRSITGTAERIVVTNGDGVASSPTIDLATVTQAATGSFVKVTLDGYGRVTGNTAVTTGDITALVDATYVNVAGDTMTGNLNMGGTATVTGLTAPVNPTDAATKLYVDTAVEGLKAKPAVEVIAVATADLSALGSPVYDNGTAGVGATLTAGINGAFPAIDGITVTSTTFPDNGVMIAYPANDVRAVYNGRYNLTTVGDAGTKWVLTRCGLCDESSEIPGSFTFVKKGTVYAGSGWVQTQGTDVNTNGIIDVGADQIWVTQFSGAGSYTADTATGIKLNGTQFSLNLGAGIAANPTSEIGIDLFNASTGALILTTDGTARSTDTASQLHLLLAATGGLTQDATGLYIPAAGVTNAMLANSSLSADADTGTGTLALGGTLNIVGTALQGISTSVSGGTFTITAADATTTSKGVASFADANFAVTAGAVSIKTGGISNANLANSTITFTGDTGSEAVALGESFDFNGDSTFITTAVSGNVVSLTLGTVDVAHGGTGLTTVAANQVLFGGAANTITQDVDFAFDSTTNTLTVGSATIAGATGGDVTITATGTNGDINLVPNGTGSVVIGPAGAGEITSEAGQALTVTGSTILTLASLAGDVVLSLANNTTDKVTVAGPTATDYATNLADADLVNKLYVDTAIQSGAASGSIKAVKATVNLGATGSTNIGAALPAGATILRVKVQVTSADSGAGILEIGKTGLLGGYMAATENDPQSTGMYVAETYVVEGSSVQVTATVSGTAASGSAIVFVEYQVA